MLGGGFALWYLSREKTTEVVVSPSEVKEIEEGVFAVELNEVGESALLPPTAQVYQTWNNCGPAAVSMILSFYGIQKSQAEIGEEMRPYQNPHGDNDDKTIFPQEFADYVKRFGLESIYRVGGDTELLKKFVANGLPVVVKQWLHQGEDIGHFRIVRGFDATQKVFLTDDSYDGPNRKIKFLDFEELWQSFNYGYIVVYPKDSQAVVEAILGDDINPLNGGNRAFSELYQIRGECFLALGEKEKARVEFEKAVHYNVNYQPAKEALLKL